MTLTNSYLTTCAYALALRRASLTSALALLFALLSVRITCVYVSVHFLGILPDHGDGRLNTFSLFETWSSPHIPYTFATLWLSLRCVQHVRMFISICWKSTTLPATDSGSSRQTLENKHQWVLGKNQITGSFVATNFLVMFNFIRSINFYVI